MFSNTYVTTGIMTWVGLAGLNFVFEAIQDHNYAQAFDRSYFEALGMICYFIATRRTRHLSN